MNTPSFSTDYSAQGYLVFGIPRDAVPERLIYLTENNLPVFKVAAPFDPNEYISGVKMMINMIAFNGRKLTSQEAVFGVNGGSPVCIRLSFR